MLSLSFAAQSLSVGRVSVSAVTCWLRKSFLDADHSDGCGEAL